MVLEGSPWLKNDVAGIQPKFAQRKGYDEHSFIENLPKNLDEWKQRHIGNLLLAINKQNPTLSDPEEVLGRVLLDLVSYYHSNHKKHITPSMVVRYIKKETTQVEKEEFELNRTVIHWLEKCLCSPRVFEELSVFMPLRIKTSSSRSNTGGILSNLSHRDRHIVELRFGLGDRNPHTLQEIAELFKLTKERIRQIEIKALAKIRKERMFRKNLMQTWDPETHYIFLQVYEAYLYLSRDFLKRYPEYKSRKEKSEAKESKLRVQPYIRWYRKGDTIYGVKKSELRDKEYVLSCPIPSVKFLIEAILKVFSERNSIISYDVLKSIEEWYNKKNETISSSLIYQRLGLVLGIMQLENLIIGNGCRPRHFHLKSSPEEVETWFLKSIIESWLTEMFERGDYADFMNWANKFPQTKLIKGLILATKVKLRGD